jgi:hypothetical protein
MKAIEKSDRKKNGTFFQLRTIDNIAKNNLKLLFLLALTFGFISQNSIAQQSIEARGNNADTAAFLPTTSQGQNLDLSAVLAVFQDSKGLEDFEQKINSENGINNLDLNGDSIVDYVRVLEKEEGEYRVIVLQSIIGENEFQDVAYINILKKAEEDYDVQAEGNTRLYGENYYVSPQRDVQIHIYRWPVWTYMYVPHYHYYNSPYYWGYYPRWYHRYHYVHYDYYYSRVYTYHSGYYCHRTVRIHRPHHVYSPRNSQYVRTSPAVKTGDRPSKPGNTSYTPRGKEAKPGAPQQINKQNTIPRAAVPAVKQAPRAVEPARTPVKAKPSQPKQGNVQPARTQNKPAKVNSKPAKQSQPRANAPKSEPKKSSSAPARGTQTTPKKATSATPNTREGR